MVVVTSYTTHSLTASQPGQAHHQVVGEMKDEMNGVFTGRQYCSSRKWLVLFAAAAVVVCLFVVVTHRDSFTSTSTCLFPKKLLCLPGSVLFLLLPVVFLFLFDSYSFFLLMIRYMCVTMACADRERGSTGATLF